MTHILAILVLLLAVYIGGVFIGGLILGLTGNGSTVDFWLRWQITKGIALIIILLTTISTINHFA